MRRFFITAAALAALASPLTLGARASFADTTSPPPAADAQQGREQARAAMLEAHIAGMKAGLALTAEQQKNWPPLEAAIRAAAKEGEAARMQMRQQMSSDERPSPIERMRRMSQRLSRISDELTKVADAGKPLYDSLTEPQKRVFGPLLRAFVEHGHRGEHMEGAGARMQ
jgi:hypothetical protein